MITKMGYKDRFDFFLTPDVGKMWFPDFSKKTPAELSRCTWSREKLTVRLILSSMIYGHVCVVMRAVYSGQDK